MRLYLLDFKTYPDFGVLKIKVNSIQFSEERHERATICYESLTSVKQMLQSRQHHQPLTSGEQGKVRSALVELAVF